MLILDFKLHICLCPPVLLIGQRCMSGSGVPCDSKAFCEKVDCGKYSR